MLAGPAGAPALGIGLVADHRPPSWPDVGGRKQFHLDLACDDIVATEAYALGLGATLADPQPGGTWRVLVSPAGHPLCLTDAANWWVGAGASVVELLEQGELHICRGVEARVE